jgi:hypothetical protein
MKGRQQTTSGDKTAKTEDKIAIFGGVSSAERP